MSVTSAPLDPPTPGSGRLWQRLGLMLMAVAIVAPDGTARLGSAPSVARTEHPFGMGIREAAPSGNIGAWILTIQSGFYASLQASVRA